MESGRYITNASSATRKSRDMSIAVVTRLETADGV